MGPKLAFSEQMHSEKYRGQGETFREAMNRIASALADDDKHFKAFKEIISDMRFLPGGRIQAAIGSTRNVTPFNCYVSGTIEDSFVAGYGSIMERATEAAATMRLGGGIGYDFSTLRPRGEIIKKLQSASSGPVSFMGIFNAVCICIASAGYRRGAEMGVLRIDHPDIEEFIRAKQNGDKLTGFNLSVAVTDDFMASLKLGSPFQLKWGGKVYKEVDPSIIWEILMRSTWDWGEPGVIFIDQVNKMNNLHYCETIAATNPCGEQPLPPFGACLLGSFNLVKYVVPGSPYLFNRNQFVNDIKICYKAMDNVIGIAQYPLREQKKEALDKRRMGIGITGLANAAEALGYEYGSSQFLNFMAVVLNDLRVELYLASSARANDLGSFPLFKEKQFLDSEYAKTLPNDVRVAIKRYGLRNSHLLSIAPTGTISLCADNVSSGIEPVFAYEFERAVHTESGLVNEKVTDYGVRVFGTKGKVAKDVTIKEHLDVLSMANVYVDSAVSKTCNVPHSMKWEDFKNIYIEAWERGCKGCTTFTNGGKRSGIFVEEAGEEAVACGIDLDTGKRDCD